LAVELVADLASKIAQDSAAVIDSAAADTSLRKDRLEKDHARLIAGTIP
jgi:hypothetical protein